MPLKLVVKKKNSQTVPRKLAQRKGKGSATTGQLKWLVRGLTQAGGKLPLFDENGQRINERTVLSCLEKGWVKPWFNNPIKPDWQVCCLTKSGREIFFDT